MKWENISDEKKLTYILQSDTEIELSFNRNGSYYEGECLIENKSYSISRKGFWKTFVSLIDEKGKQVAGLTQEKWYFRKWRLQIDEHNYYIRYQNNPLFELIIEDYSAETVMKYRLITDDNDTDVELEILSEARSKDHVNIMALMGWYIVLPICFENAMGAIENLK